MRKAFLSPTAAATQQRWYSLWKLKLLNTIITLFYGAFAIRGLMGGALRYCHTFQVDPFLVANKTFLSARDPAGIRWLRPLYLWIDRPFSFHSKFKTHNPSHHTQNKRTVLYIPVGQYCSETSHNNPPHQLASLFINASSTMYCWNYS